MRCPRCQIEMAVAHEQAPAGRIELDFCRRCRGIWFDSEELGAILHLPRPGLLARGSPLWSGDAPSELLCPREGHSPMSQRTLTGLEQQAPPLHIDQCLGCEGVWLDGSELQQVAEALRSGPAQQVVHGEPGTGALVWLFMFLSGLPVEGYNPRRRLPLCVIALIALCSVGLALQMATDLGATVARFGMVPQRLWDGAIAPLFSYMFLHGGPLHLLGNLYFLWVFGDNVEDRLGPWRFLGLYLTSGVAAGLLHAALATDATAPVVGASGAISGVMAAYAILFPHARLVSLILLWRVRWRVSTYLGMWLIYQVIGAALHMPGIAWWAHIGGFLMGGFLAWRLR